MSDYDNLVGERKNLTVLFADIVGSTARVDGLDAEEASQFLGTIVGRLARLVTNHGGTTIHRLGDGIVAVFGAPIAVEDHAVRACHAALAMQRAIQGVAGLGREAPAAIRVGINTGEAVVRPDPLDVFGIVVHVASRLQSNAQPGEIWISHATLSAVGTAFTCSSIGFKSLKNVQQPVEVHVLEQGRQNERPRFGLEHWNIDVPFVGRAREKAILADCLRKLSSGSGCILGIWGDAGIGKSRLLEEVRCQAGRSLLWLQGSGTSLGRSISYLPILQIVRRYIGSQEEEDAETLWNKLSDSVRDLFGSEGDDVLPYLASFLGIEVRSELSQRVAYLDGEAMGRQVRRSLRLFFQKVARRKPTVLMLEDFYWADESTAALLVHLFPLTQTDPLAICFIGRGEPDSLDGRLREVAASSHAPVYVEIALKALQPQEGTQLFNALFSGETRMARLRETILASAEGNPLFVEEVVRTLLETKALVRDPHDGKWILTSDVEAIRIPATIQDLISARVDRLPEDVKFVLTVASVIGKAFLYKVLHAITERTLELDKDLANLLKHGFIGEHARDPELEYIFRHAVIQEVTYDCILRARRRQLHQKVGEALELLFADNLDEMSGALAYHFGRAEIWERAQKYLITAGARADRLAADGESLHHYRQAVDACRHVFGERMDLLLMSTIERKLGEAYYRRGEHDEAFRHFERALDRIGGSSVAHEGSLRKPLAREILVQLFHLAGLFRTAKNTSGTSIEDRTAIYQMMGWMFLFDDPVRLLLCLLVQLNEAERYSYAFGNAFASAFLVYCCDVAGLPSLAQRYHKKAARAARKAKNPVADCLVELVQGWHLAYRGTNVEAIKSFEQAAALGWKCGDLRAYGSAIFGQSIICCQQGRFREAWGLAKKQEDIGNESGDRVAIRMSLLVRGMVLARTGRWHESEAALRDCLDRTESSHDNFIFPFVSSELGLCLARQNRIADAEAVFSSAAKVVIRRKLRGHPVVFLKVAIAETVVAKAERLSAADRAFFAVNMVASAKSALLATKIYRACRPQALRVMGSCYWHAGKKTDAMKMWDLALSEAKQMGSDYELAQINLSVGRVTRNHQRSEQGSETMKTLLAKVY